MRLWSVLVREVEESRLAEAVVVLVEAWQCWFGRIVKVERRGSPDLVGAGVFD